MALNQNIFFFFLSPFFHIVPHLDSTSDPFPAAALTPLASPREVVDEANNTT